MKSVERFAQLAQMACIREACASKPGSVNLRHDFTDVSLEDFMISAVAIGPSLENAADASVGQTIWRAIQDTQRWVSSNTNLGIVLLLAPLVKACLINKKIAGGEASPQSVDEDLRETLNGILKSLTVEDARLAYAAIRCAKPGGLGKVSSSDVAREPSLTLLQAMELAQDRDSIAREYISGFKITFETGLPALRESVSRIHDFSGAVVQTFLTILAHVPDTLISRKRGPDAASQVSKRARQVLEAGGVLMPEGREELSAMDRELRDESHVLNPGTTSDLTAAVIFLALIENPNLIKTVTGCRFQVKNQSPATCNL
jgi:triphosphoribosyl-dephospho-CoA synthase